jgi:hypothetical protein
MSDLSPQSGPKRKLIRSLSPIAIFMSTRLRALPAAGRALALPAIVHTPPSRDLPRLTAQRLRQGEVITGGFPVLEKLEDGSRDLLPLRAAYEFAFSWHRAASILLGDRGPVAVALRSAQGAI